MLEVLTYVPAEMSSALAVANTLLTKDQTTLFGIRDYYGCCLFSWPDMDVGALNMYSRDQLVHPGVFLCLSK